MRKFLLLILLSGITFFITKDVSAQGVTTASINGIVTDAKGPIPGATVSITHTPTGTVYSTVTRTDGRFNLPNLRVGGPYTFKVTFIGYKDNVQENITLSIGQDQKLDVKLVDNTTTLGEVVIRGSAGKVINSSRTGARETINRQQIENLPTINRSLADFTKLTPSANGLSFGGRSSNFNNLTVDGALFNNSFGLSGTLGGQTGSQPISLDAIDQIQVDIAPYDVRQGNFTGAGVNTVVKSGTNTIKGTVYDYLRSTGLTGYNAAGTKITKTPFNYHQLGASIGAPIIKNKLFLFVSGEEERVSAPYSSYVATGSGASGNVSLADAATLDAIKQKLINDYGYNPGAYQGYNLATYSNKLTVKLDWNINKNNVLSAKYFYLKSYADQPPSNSGTIGVNATTRSAGLNTLPFFGAGYRINNNFNIGIVELDTHISDNLSNKLTAGYSALRDFRASSGSSAIPMVDIGNGQFDPVSGKIAALTTSFGYELFTAGNLLNTNIAQFSDDLTLYSGKHEFTFGTNDQIQSYKNGFAPDYNGQYTFNSAADFLNNAPAASYAYRYSALPDGSFPYAKIKASIFSVYVQDKFHVTDKFLLTYGIRADYDVFPTSLAKNENAAALTFQGGYVNGIHVDPSKLPSNRVLVSPRVGFNWDVFGDQTTQVRGGTGIFAGTVPFVWISNQASNNGLLFSSGTVTTPGDPRLLFNPDVNHGRPVPTPGNTVAPNTSYELDVANPNLKYPEIWRTNLAVDHRLPGGIIATVEGAYTKDINAIYHQNLVVSNDFTVLNGPEGQIRYKNANFTQTPAKGGANTGTINAQNPIITGLYYMNNTSKGYSYFVTGQLQKSFSNGIYANVAYTHSGSKDVNDGGSTASTIWSTRYVAGNPNADNLSNSSFVQPNRVIASVFYKKSYADHASTSVGLLFEMANNGAVSYLTGGDPNNDGATNDLMYVPKTQSDIILVPNNTDITKGPIDTRDAATQWAQLNNFINQDKYLSKHRGEFTQRNGVILPYFKRLDLKVVQDFYVMVGKSKNTIEISFDMINVGNFINKNWGNYQTTFTGVNFGSVTILNYKGTDASGRPTYSFPYLNAAKSLPVTESFVNGTSQLSRWQGQLGLRYIFN